MVGVCQATKDNADSKVCNYPLSDIINDPADIQTHELAHDLPTRPQALFILCC